MERITLKKLWESRASERDLKACRLAIKSLKGTACGLARYETAKKTLWWLSRVNGAREKELELDSCERTQELAKIYTAKIDEYEKHLKAYAGKLGLRVVWSTWCHLADKSGNWCC